MDDSNNNSESSPNLEEAAQESSDPPPAEENKSNDETSSEQSPPTEADKPESQENKDANVVTEPSSITEAATTPNNNQDNATSPAPSEKDKEDANKTPAALVKDSDKSDTVAVSATLEDVKNAGENSLSGLAKSVENEKSSFLSFLTGMNASQKSNATDEDDDETNAHNVAGFLDEESAPLLPRPAATARRFLDRIWLILFLALVVGGVSIGAFLLIWLGKSEYQSTHFVLMNKSDWAIYQPVRPMKKLNLPIKNVALIQINAFDSKYCNQDTFYANCVQQIQKKNIFKMLQADILYNFVVDEAGTIYEGRGWNNCTCTENYTDKDLTIGILINHDGTVTNSVPTFIQNFIDDAITKAMVDPCFNMSIHNGTAISMIKEHVKINNNLC